MGFDGTGSVPKPAKPWYSAPSNSALFAKTLLPAISKPRS